MNQPFTRTVLDGDYRVRLTTQEFLAIASMPPLDAMKLELVHGEMERMPPPFYVHSETQADLVEKLRAVARKKGGYVGLGDLAIDLGEDTLLGCDAAIVRKLDENRTVRPDEVLLVVEISSTTQARDLGMKRREYARAGVADYWVVDVDARMTHRFTAPADGEYRALEPAAFGAALEVPGTGQSIVID